MISNYYQIAYLSILYKIQGKTELLLPSLYSSSRIADSRAVVSVAIRGELNFAAAPWADHGLGGSPRTAGYLNSTQVRRYQSGDRGNKCYSLGGVETCRAIKRCEAPGTLAEAAE